MKNNKTMTLLILMLLYISIGLSVFGTTYCTYAKESNIILVSSYEINNANNIEEQEEDYVESLEENNIENTLTQMESEIDKLNHIEDKMQWFIKYKDVIDQYEEIGTPDTIYKWYDQDDIYLMQRTIETECYQADFMSKVNVANVIINRIQSGDFGQSVEEVIKAENQFSYWRKDISKDTILALEYAFMFEDTTNGSVAFRSDSSPEYWGRWKKSFTDEVNHSFYK